MGRHRFMTPKRIGLGDGRCLKCRLVRGRLHGLGGVFIERIGGSGVCDKQIE